VVFVVLLWLLGRFLWERLGPPVFGGADDMQVVEEEP
jgi:hypothetical protein